jgi:hypothetical protein
MNYLKISWWNDHDLGEILYQDGYKNVIYLDVEVDKPEYNVTLESDLNGDNVEITKFRKWEKVYKFECWMQEDLVDAFSLMQIHDNIEVTLQSGDIIQVAKHGLRVEPSWEEIGCLAKCIVSFAENYVVAGNCDENMDLDCYCEDTGEFAFIDDGTAPASPEHTVILLYTVADIIDYKYTASLYEASNNYTWLPLAVPDQYSCYVNQSDSTIWIWDGQFWQRVPGYFYASALVGGVVYTMTGWILPGTFATIYYNAGIGWVDAGTFTADQISSGADITIIGSGTILVRMHVWNHSCDYGYTDEYDVVVP